MDNPARTAEYISRRDARQAELKQILDRLLSKQLSLTLEIGSGHGHFLTDYAAVHREEFCVGVDLIAERVRRAERKRERAKLGNLAFLQAEAAECLAQLPGGIGLQRIFILFPDPWPKRRHHKNRLMQAEFLSDLAARTSAGAHLFFRTDDAPYFSFAEAAVKNHPGWQISDSPWPFERETVFQSRAPAYQSLIAKRRTTEGAQL